MGITAKFFALQSTALSNQNCNGVALIRMAITKKSTNNKFWRRCGEKGTLLLFLWECKLMQPLWRIVWRFLKKLKTELPYDPAIPFLDILWKKIHNSKGHMYPNIVH